MLKTGVTYELAMVHALNEVLAERDGRVVELAKRRAKLESHQAAWANGATETKGSLVTKKRDLSEARPQRSSYPPAPF